MKLSTELVLGQLPGTAQHVAVALGAKEDAVRRYLVQATGEGTVSVVPRHTGQRSMYSLSKARAPTRWTAPLVASIGWVAGCAR